MALCVWSDKLFVFGSDPKVLQDKRHSKLGVVNSLPVIFLMNTVVTMCYLWVAHDSARITAFLLRIRTEAQRWWGKVWELDPPAPALSVMEKLCLPERMKNTMWPENLGEKVMSGLKNGNLILRAFSGRNKFLTQQIWENLINAAEWR